jgi:NTP pyrophosphatase (non-canonical NTP hydrolase)
MADKEKDKITNKAIGKAFEAVYQFNEIAGVFQSDSKEAIDLYLSLTFEELSESITAFENSDPKELLDGAADVFVTVAGLLQVMQKAGFNVQEALKRVTDNNLQKFPKTIPLGMQRPAGWVISWNNQYGVHVIKDEKGKVRKPVPFYPVDLSGLYPVDFFKEASTTKEAT